MLTRAGTLDEIDAASVSHQLAFLRTVVGKLSGCQDARRRQRGTQPNDAENGSHCDCQTDSPNPPAQSGAARSCDNRSALYRLALRRVRIALEAFEVSAKFCSRLAANVAVF